MLNHIIIMGRLVRDPELRYTQSQVPVASFTIACDRNFTNRDSGEKQTDFIDCVAWRSTAEFISKYFFKGSMAVVEGRLQVRNWEDSNGQKRRNSEIVVDNIYFGDSKRKEDSGDSYQSSYTGNYSQTQDDREMPGHRRRNRSHDRIHRKPNGSHKKRGCDLYRRVGVHG